MDHEIPTIDHGKLTIPAVKLTVSYDMPLDVDSAILPVYRRCRINPAVVRKDTILKQQILPALRGDGKVTALSKVQFMIFTFLGFLAE